MQQRALTVALPVATLAVFVAMSLIILFGAAGSTSGSTARGQEMNRGFLGRWEQSCNKHEGHSRQYYSNFWMHYHSCKLEGTPINGDPYIWCHRADGGNNAQNYNMYCENTARWN